MEILMKIGPILVPCDFSASSLAALRFASELAARYTAQLIVLTILDSAQSEEKAQEEVLKGQFGQAATVCSANGLKIRQLISRGKFVPVVLETIAKEKIGLVVLGTKGSRGWDGLFMGSHAEKIVRTSPVPVIAVRGESHLDQVRNIVVPCNMAEDENKAAKGIKDLQLLLHAHVHLLYVNILGTENEDEPLKQLREYGARLGLVNYTVNVSYAASETEGILHFAAEIGADMIAIATHGEKSPAKMYSPSIAADVVNHGRVLTWTCPIGRSPGLMAMDG
ncbi:universal stress protein [Dyadobacter sp. MSC1_007]|jgi:nucleotide-binding universal stress UspA family protein|uniref:universal stress protein n=1 Tax=Dyadobacter sp. MSC1_007 TaxID=2909264 RepID=UPI00202ECC27|nr:universal stress protein [Dyadobacter sp. MSC1_007]